MKTSLIAILALAASAAFAHEGAEDPSMRGPFADGQTRAEAKAELAAAQQAGELRSSEYTTGMATFKAERSRTEVRGEARQVTRARAIVDAQY